METKKPKPPPAGTAQQHFDQTLEQASLERQLELVRALLNATPPPKK